jgi:hypothetical protein
VSELWPLTCLLFIPRVAYDYGKPRWHYVDRRKLPILVLELSGNSVSSHLVAKQ